MRSQISKWGWFDKDHQELVTKPLKSKDRNVHYGSPEHRWTDPRLPKLRKFRIQVWLVFRKQLLRLTVEVGAVVAAAAAELLQKSQLSNFRPLKLRNKNRPVQKTKKCCWYLFFFAEQRFLIRVITPTPHPLEGKKFGFGFSEPRQT